VSGLTFGGVVRKSDVPRITAALSFGSHGDPTVSNFVTGEDPGATADAAALPVAKT
jgi:hypothetical protein